MSVDALGVLLRDLVRDGGQVGDVATDEEVGVELRQLDLLRQVGAEGHDTGPEVARVERDVDTGEGDRREATLESDEPSLLLEVLGLLYALVDNLAQVLLDLVDRHGLGEFREVDLLHLEEVEDVRERLEADEVTRDNVLLTLDVVVDDLDENVAAASDRLDDLTERGVTERLADPRRVDSDHAVRRSVLRVALDGALHRDTAVEDDVDEGRDREDVGDRGEGRVLSERVTGERTRGLDESLRAHVLERGLLSDDEGDLRELGRVEETGRGRERVPRRAKVNVSEQGESLDVAIGIGWTANPAGSISASSGKKENTFQPHDSLVVYVISMYFCLVAWPLRPPKWTVFSLGLVRTISRIENP